MCVATRRRPLAALALACGFSALAVHGGGEGPTSCADGGNQLCAGYPGFQCHDLEGAGFECVGQTGTCPDHRDSSQSGHDPMGANLPAHTNVLFVNPGRPSQEQRMYSVSVVNGTVPAVNYPQARVQCKSGYQGIPEGLPYNVTLKCSCTPGVFGSSQCTWGSFEEVLAQVVEAAGRNAQTSVWASCRKAGCMDRNAFNYDTSAQVDDGSCIAKFRGCMDPNAANYNPYVNVNDPSSCIQNADVDGDDCAPDPCGEHGSCHDLFKAWRCVCNSGWSGRQCDSPPGSAPPPPAGQCPDGTYSGSNGKCQACTTCPPGFAEHTACTATTDSDCQACPSGRYNDGTWAEGGCHDCHVCCQGWLLQHGGGCRPDRDTQCFECAAGRYGGQDKNTEGQCLECSRCANSAEVCVHNDEAACSATDSFAQEPTCDTKDSHCQNGGATISGCEAAQGINLFGTVIDCQCSCLSGWVGKHCELESPCKNNPCNNGGTCQERDMSLVADGELAYTCQCLPGFSGAQCQVHSSFCTPCCHGVTNCTNGTSAACVNEASAAECVSVLPSGDGPRCDPPCDHGGQCIDLGFEGWTQCKCISPWMGDDCKKSYNISVSAQQARDNGGGGDSAVSKVVNDMRDTTGVNISNQMIYILVAILSVLICGVLSACVLGCRRHRAKLLEQREELEMRMVPQGPTGLGHLRDNGLGSIKDLSQLPDYKPEPGFEDFDYDPHKEGAGEWPLTSNMSELKR